MAKSASDAQGRSEETTSLIGSNTQGGQPGKMAHPERQKLPKFMGNGSEDPVRHCKTCETIWIASAQDDPDQWLRAFLATLRDSAIDWYSELDQAQRATWRVLKQAF